VKRTHVIIRSKTRGSVEVTDMAPNGSWLTITFVKYTRAGNVAAEHKVTVDLFDATEIARKTHEALVRHASHHNRMRLRARGEGY
jgi:hypothetical protein